MITLNAVNGVSFAAYGGKAHNLSRLILAGLPVPPGIALAYDDQPTVSRLMQYLRLAGVSDHAQLAVRSSAIGEDGTEASFAGQHDTKLFVPWEGALAAIDEVRRSADSARARAYRENLGMKHIRMGVVLQQMVPATLSAIVFTVNPLTGDREIVIEATAGTGERLVGGQVIPTSYVAGADHPTLPPPYQDLVYLAERIAPLYAGSADIEAAYDGRWWIVQARPITAL